MVRAPHSNDFFFSTCLPENPKVSLVASAGRSPLLPLLPVVRGPEAVLADVGKPRFSAE